MRDCLAAFLESAVQGVASPLTRYFPRWEALVSNDLVLRTVREGHRIPFSEFRPPRFGGFLETDPGSPAVREFLRGELQSLLAKGAVSQVPADLAQSGFYSHFFTVPKKSGELRPILNLSELNLFVEDYKFGMITTPMLLAMVKQGDCFSSVDLKDAYFHVPVFEGDRKYLRFRFEGRSYQYNCLPFGYKLAPITFTRVVKAALGVLMRLGIRLVWYIDDLLVLADSPELCMAHTLLLMQYLQYMGFAINWKKSAPWPMRQAPYLGLRLDSALMRATLTGERWDSTRAILSHFAPGSRVTYATIKKMLGLLSSAHQVVHLGLLYMREFQLWFTRYHRVWGDDPQFDNRWVTVPRSVKGDWDHWMAASVERLGVPMGPKLGVVTIFTDASLLGWGGLMGYEQARGLWPEGHDYPINVLEMEAVWLSILRFAPNLKGRHILVMTDNMTARAYINRQGGMVSENCRFWARRIWLWVSQNALSIAAEYVPGKENVAADMLSRGGPRDDDWSLNPLIVQRLWALFGEARVDLFASKENAKCPLWFSLSPTDCAPLGVNALGLEPWPRVLLYAFPPYRLLPGLLDRFEAEGHRLILVAPFETSNSWFPRMVRWIKGARFDLPLQEDAISQAKGQIRQGPWVRQTRLAAWLLVKPL